MMKSIVTLLAVGLLLLAASCDDDDPFNPLTTLSRFDGWFLVSVESDFAAQVDAAVAAVSDEDLLQLGQTRAELRAEFDDEIAAVTGVEDCELDNVIFFDQGVVAVIENGQPCPAGSGPDVLVDFNPRRYSSDLEVTRLTLNDDDGTFFTEYTVTTITPEAFSLQQDRTVTGNLVLPNFTYSITYNFRAR